MAGTITAANANIAFSQAILFPTPVEISEFATDDVFDTDQMKSIEAQMGVDGVLSFGFVFVPVVQNFALQANSDSVTDFFDLIHAQQQAAEDVYPLNGSVVLPGPRKKYLMFNGGMTGYTPTPAAKRVLQMQRFQITWNKIVPARL